MFTTSKRGNEERGGQGEGRSTTDIPPLCGRASGGVVVCGRGRRPSAYAFFPSMVKLLQQRLCDFLAPNNLPLR